MGLGHGEEYEAHGSWIMYRRPGMYWLDKM